MRPLTKSCLKDGIEFCLDVQVLCYVFDGAPVHDCGIPNMRRRELFFRDFNFVSIAAMRLHHPFIQLYVTRGIAKYEGCT